MDDRNFEQIKTAITYMKNLDKVFTYTIPTSKQIEEMDAIRQAALDFATVVLRHSPASADQAVAIEKIREASYYANSAVILKGII